MATKRHELIDELLATRRQAQRLALSLRFHGLDDKAEEAQEKEKELTAQIDTLLAGSLDSWVQKANDLTKRLTSINERLSFDVEKVRKRDQKTAYIARALGALGDVIQLVRKLAV
jgi:chromosome segregation ATPase